MLPVFLASVTPYVGKNVVALGLAKKFQQEKKSVGYFKPIGPLPVHSAGVLTDEDAVFFKKALSLAEPLDALCPVVLNDQTLAHLLRGTLGDVRERILAGFRQVAQGKDVVITVGMGRLSCGRALEYPMQKFVRDIEAKVVVVERYQWPVEALDGILHIKGLVPERFAGVIFNRILGSRASHIDQAVRPFLKTHGVEVLGIIPDDTILGAVPVADLVEALDGRVLVGGDKLDVLAEHFSIGAMSEEAALRFFQRIPNQAVITGGDRADIQLAALQTSTRCLILTGDLYPNERILTRAEELGVPVILVGQDTSTTIEICEHLRGHLTLQSERKIARASEITGACMNWDLLHKRLGIK